jgi:hypothetical protein
MRDEPLYHTFRHLADQALSELLSQRQDIVGAYLYGSLATGTLTPASDLDLVVLLNAASGIQRSFVYYGRTPVDCLYVPKGCFGVEGLPQIEPPLGMGLYEGIILADPQGILRAAQDYLRQHLFSPAHQGLWFNKMVKAARKHVHQAESFLQQDDWLNVQVACHEGVLRFGQGIGYLTQRPPNPVMNLFKIAEASQTLGMPQLYEGAKHVYTLPASVQAQELKRWQARLSESYEQILHAVVASGNGEEERSKASPFSPARPNRWDFIATKLESLLMGSREEGYSGLVWAAVELSRGASPWLAQETSLAEQLERCRNTILTAPQLTKEVAGHRIERLSQIIAEAEQVAAPQRA